MSELSDDEVTMGVSVATRRKLSSERRRQRGDAPRSPDRFEARRTWDQEIESTLAEISVAGHYNRYWTGAHYDNTAGVDVGGSIGVRWTWHEDGHLPIYTTDPPELPVVLVVGFWPKQELRGWTYARDAMHPEFWRPNLNCWYLPQENLRQISPRHV